MLERVWPEEDNAPTLGGWAVDRGKLMGADNGARPSICSFICLLSQLITVKNRENYMYYQISDTVHSTCIAV